MSSQVADWGRAPAFDEFDRLEKALKVARMTRGEMADYLEVDRKTVNNWLNGRTPMRRAHRVAWALRTGVSIGWLETGNAPTDGPGRSDSYTARDSNPEPADLASYLVRHALAA